MASATQITLQESFLWARPSFNQGAADYILITGNSGASTEATDPPKVWIHYPVDNYITLADAELDLNRERLQRYLPIVEIPFMIFNEYCIIYPSPNQ